MALDFFAGCLGGCAGIMVGYPLDTIKVHIQTQDHRNPKYKGTWHCFRKLIAQESVAGLYRGMSSPMAGVALVNAIVFGAYGQTQKHFNASDLSCHFMAGAVAGLAQAPVCSPIELAKTRLQLQQASSQKFSGPLQCLKHIFKVEGFRGIFNGLGITCLREAPSYGVYFLTYEAMTRSDSPVPISTLHMLFAGGMAGTASWIISYPLDVIKSRMQAEGIGRYVNAMDCYRKSVQAEGYSCLFRGLNSTIIRAFPTNAATFAVVTWTFRLCGEQTGIAQTQIEESKPVIPVRKQVKKSHQTFIDRWNNFISNVSDKGRYVESYHSTMALSFLGANIETNSKLYQKEFIEDQVLEQLDEEDDDYIDEDETRHENFSCEWIMNVLLNRQEYLNDA